MPTTAISASQLDFDRCFRALQARDARFDGQFFVAVRTTGIYCRPSCPAITPKPGNVSFVLTAAAAQQNGYRACRRCLPDAVPGSPRWNINSDLASRAMRLIEDGIVDRDGVNGLAQHLGYSPRQLGRVLGEQIGAGPLALARAYRATTARMLIQCTTMPMSDIAFAAGFASIRQFNDTVREVFAQTPTALRAKGATNAPGATGSAVTLKLAVRQPFTPPWLRWFLSGHAIAGVESWDGHIYRRSMSLPHGPVIVGLEILSDHVRADLRLHDMRDLGVAVHRIRQLLDLDADVAAANEVLAADPALAPLIAERPGIRAPRMYRRLRSSPSYDDRPADLFTCRTDPRRQTGCGPGETSDRAGRRHHPPLPHGRRGGRARDAGAHRAGRPHLGHRRREPSRSRRPPHHPSRDAGSRGAYPAARPARNRFVDRGLRDDATAQQPRCAAQYRPGAQTLGSGPGDRSQRHRTLVAVALVRIDALVGPCTRANGSDAGVDTHLHPCTHKREDLMSTAAWSTISTPTGPFTMIVDSDGQVLASGWSDDPEYLKALVHKSIRPLTLVDKPDLGEVTTAAKTYHQGDLTAIDNIPVRQRSGEFLEHAWDVLREVPAGAPVSYTEYAARSGRPAAIRAAASACARNAAALFVPCHRVLRTDKTLGGFRYGLDVKRWLIAHEERA